ncbi:MAG: glycosyltransferase [Saprospiraceae bacterium]
MQTISVVIPTFNEAENLLKIYQYFDQYDIHPDEVIIADYYQKHDNPYYQSQFKSWKYVPCHRAGRAYQMNQGAAHAQSDIIMFLHADVLPPVKYKENILQSINEGNHFGFFAYRFNPTSFLLNINARFTAQKGIFSGGGDQIHFMTRQLYLQMGGYDEKCTVMEDFEFFQRIKKLHQPFTIIQDRATVSSRKYKDNSWLRVNIANLLAFTLFTMNTAPDTIKKMYYKILKK